MVLKGPMQTLNSWWAMFSEVSEQPESHKHSGRVYLMYHLWLCLVVGDGRRRETKLSRSVYRKMKLNSLHSCMCFAQNSDTQHAKLWLWCLCKCPKSHQKEKLHKITLTWATTFLQEHIFFWPHTWWSALGSQHHLAPVPPWFVPIWLFSVTFGWSSPSASVLMSLTSYTETTQLHALIFLTDLK